jgi:large subunit ribosomal protein L10
MDGQILSPEDVLALSKLPSREELLSKVLGSVQSPLYGFAGVLNGLLRNLVGVVAAIEEKQRTGAGE